MKTKLTAKVLLAVAGIAALTFSGNAQAQTANVTAAVTVQNALTLTVVNNINFGIVAAISDAAQTATLDIDATTNALAASTTGAPAVFASIDSTAAKGGDITVEDGANGATINITINNVIDPISGPSAFTLARFETAYNAGATVSRTAGTPFTATFDTAYASGVNNLAIGAGITTKTTVATYADATYNGSFDVVFSY